MDLPSSKSYPLFASWENEIRTNEPEIHWKKQEQWASAKIIWLLLKNCILQEMYVVKRPEG